MKLIFASVSLHSHHLCFLQACLELLNPLYAAEFFFFLDLHHKIMFRLHVSTVPLRLVTCFACERIRKSISCPALGQERALRLHVARIQVAHLILTLLLAVHFFYLGAACHRCSAPCLSLLPCSRHTYEGGGSFASPEPFDATMYAACCSFCFAWCNTRCMHAAAHAIIRLALIIMADFAA
jgi:hypothetical protein